jgi:acyl-CoA synthetase (AMP-forming)/AMP-acid ligase II
MSTTTVARDSSETTLGCLLGRRAEQTPDDCAYLFLADGENTEQRLTYRQLHLQAGAIAARLRAAGHQGSPAILLFPPGLDYIAAFFGCLYAGVIAVPAYPPSGPKDLPRLAAIIGDSGVRIALTSSSFVPLLEGRFDTHLEWVSTDLLDAGSDGYYHQDGPADDPDGLAFLQYTSGSTRTPRGVMLSHRNLLHNLGLMHRWFENTSNNLVASWLPPYHDMGLIGCILEPLYGGFPAVLMSPTHFLQDPYRWLSAISRYRATVSAAPNFAYELCIRKVTAEQRGQLDLRSWRIAVNGAEPVRPATLERFCELFATSGFRSTSMRPCYGLAEATLLVTTDPAGTPYSTAHADGADRTRCGVPVGDQQLHIVNPVSLQVASPGEIGEIWLSGPSVAAGYWNRPTESAALFQAMLPGSTQGYLRTGDLGCLDPDGQLLVTGRLKDLIILDGRNIYPQDVELAAESAHPAIRAGCLAAFSIPVNDEEKLILVLEISGAPEADEVAHACRVAVTEACDVEPHAVVLIPPRTMPKTPSGKVRRRACREAYLDSTLQVVGEWHRQPVVQVPYLAPRNPIEQLLAGLCVELLEVERVGVHDDFFAMGASSLLANRLVSRIQAELPVPVSLGDVFQAPTIARLAALLGDRPLAVDADRLTTLLAAESSEEVTKS